jgi:hypothetical protein
VPGPPTFPGRVHHLSGQVAPTWVMAEGVGVLFQALRYFALDGTDHANHREQASMIRRYIIWRNRNAHDRVLRELVKRANVA